MTDRSDLAAVPPVLSSGDIVAGLGAAPRELLAACLALFDDSTLQRRVGTLIDRILKRRRDSNGPTDAETAAELKGSVLAWKSSPLSDDAMRLMLWMYLREAFALPPSTFASLRSASTAADDMVARALQSIQPDKMAQLGGRLGLRGARDFPTTLDALARRTVEELMTSFLDAKDAHSKRARERLLSEMRDRVERLTLEDRKRLKDAIGSDDLNDAALRKILLTGGGLSALGASVGLAGFSAYILAAQASAFIPLLSGPALVSVVAVLSNPITIIAATAGVGWLATRSVNQKVRAAVGVRVLSLLALNGLSVGDAGIRAMLDAFRALPRLRQSTGLTAEILQSYRDDWKAVRSARVHEPSLDIQVAAAMERTPPQRSDNARLRKSLGPRGEAGNVAALACLTLGDIAYNAWCLDPRVLEGVDFARVQDLADPAAFAVFAHQVQSLGAEAHLGAISNLKGYVAERVVAAQLAAQGYVVEFPENPNEAGWDLLVDGTKFQIKDVESVSSLARHFKNGHEYPVIANAELAETLGDKDAPEWAANVYFVEGYSNNLVEQILDGSMTAGVDMLHPDVPVFAVALSAIRQYRLMHRGEVEGAQALQEVLLDGSTRAGLAVVGGYLGTGVGLVVFGPAGALVFGGLVPILSQTQAGRTRRLFGDLIKTGARRELQDKALRQTRVFARHLKSELARKLALLEARGMPTGNSPVACYLRWRVNEGLSFIRESDSRLRHIERKSDGSAERFAHGLITWLGSSPLHSVSYQAGLRELAQVFAEQPSSWAGQALGEIQKRVAEASKAGMREVKSVKKAKKREAKRQTEASSKKSATRFKRKP